MKRKLVIDPIRGDKGLQSAQVDDAGYLLWAPSGHSRPDNLHLPRAQRGLEGGTMADGM